MLVGIPRALSFYYLFPLYRAFLAGLGVDFIETPATTLKHLDNLRVCPTDEPCISVKVAFAHAADLLSKQVDALFVPAVVSLEQDNYCCPKMMGLPSMIKAGLGLDDSRLISPLVDIKDNPGRWESTWVQAARQMGISDANRARDALRKALYEWKRAERHMYEHGIPMACLLDHGVANRPHPGSARPGTDWGRGRGTESDGEPHLPTAVMGHAYLLHDMFGRTILKYVSSRSPVVLPEMISRDVSREEMRHVFEAEKMWANEAHIMGASLHLIRNGKIGKLILVTAFGCGPMSIIENYVLAEADKYGIPALYLSVDEHTGEAGLITRLEAFFDACKSREALKGCGPPGVHAGQDRGCNRGGHAPVARGTLMPSGTASSPVGIVTMGNLDISLSALMRVLGVDARIPRALSEDMVTAGKELAPEFICYPMVVLLGQMRDLAEQGVSLILMVQGKGKCRLGWYAQVMEHILQRAGYPVKVAAFDSPFPLKVRGKQFIETWKQVVGVPKLSGVIKAVTLALYKQMLADKSQDILREVRARERVRGTGDACYRQFLKELDDAWDLPRARQAFARYKRDMASIPFIREQPLKVAVAGEIYVINEPFVNREIEKMLGSFEQRVRVYRSLDVTGWLSCRIFRTPGALWQYLRTVEAAAGYLPVDVGGHGQESVGEAVRAALSGMDGVVHLFPFTCMPEIIAQNILVRVSSDLDIPVLSLMISEQTGVAGLRTRLEAFCDLIAGRRGRPGRSSATVGRWTV